jgi:PAS domain S-box-containing protein
MIANLTSSGNIESIPMDIFSDNIEINDLAMAKKLFNESRTGFLKLFNNSAVCMSMTDLRRTYVRVNKKFLDKFGFTASEIIGRTSAAVGILDKEESSRVGSLTLEKGGLQNDYVRCIAKDGKVVDAELGKGATFSFTLPNF